MSEDMLWALIRVIWLCSITCEHVTALALKEGRGGGGGGGGEKVEEVGERRGGLNLKLKLNHTHVRYI